MWPTFCNIHPGLRRLPVLKPYYRRVYAPLGCCSLSSGVVSEGSPPGTTATTTYVAQSSATRSVVGCAIRSMLHSHHERAMGVGPTRAPAVEYRVASAGPFTITPPP